MKAITARALSTPLHELSATGIVESIAAGRTNCEAVARACLERIAAREPEVQAWQYINPEHVIAQARVLDKSGKRGALHGVPFGLKDIVDTCDMPTEYGSPIYKGHQPKGDAACAALSRRAGGVLMGKTVTTEFAHRYPGKTRNPFAPSRTPGGSSSGSAAAVGDYHVPLAIGTQTTGSTIRPASYCGAFGYRPTHGDLRFTGVKEAAGSLDTLGLIARSIEDIALYRDVLLGIEPRPLPAETGAPRIGFCRTPLWSILEPHTQRLLEGAASKLARTGAKVTEVVLPAEFERIKDAQHWISSFEFTRSLAWEIDNHWESISEPLRNGRLRDGLQCTFERYIEARKLAEDCRARFADVFGDCDVLLSASATGEAPIGLGLTGDASPCVIWTTVHAPSITIPVFKGPNGLPVGVQLIAPRNNDLKLLSAARWVYRQLL